MRKNPYALFTIHRDANVNQKILQKIIKNLGELNLCIIWPIHPKLDKIITNKNFHIPNNFVVTKPKSYLNTLKLVFNSNFVITDSGGLHREAFYFKKKTFIIRNETEWPELLKNNSSKLIGDNTRLIKDSSLFIKKKITNSNVLGDGKTSKRIANLVEKLLKINE